MDSLPLVMPAMLFASNLQMLHNNGKCTEENSGINNKLSSKY